MVSNQANLFIIFSLVGVIIGLLFDGFRVLRKLFSTNDILTYIEDIVFWILTGIIIIYSMYRFCDGELRFFMILGIIFGTAIYLLTISKYVIRVLATLLNVIKRVILYPIKIIHNVTRKVVLRPIFVICINIRKIFINIVKKNKKIRGFFRKKEKYI